MKAEPINETLIAVKDLIKSEYKVEKNQTSTSDFTQYDLYNKKGEREFIIQQYKHESSRYWTTELNGCLVTDGDFYAMPKSTGLDEAYLLLGRKLRLI